MTEIIYFRIAAGVAHFGNLARAESLKNQTWVGKFFLYKEQKSKTEKKNVLGILSTKLCIQHE